MKLTEQQIETYKAAYDILLSENEVIPTTAENLKIVMRYLKTINWGMWQLPNMTIGYSANQHDCDGTIAVTITLDEPISDPELGIHNIKAFSLGAPRGYLSKYTQLR